MSSFIQVERTKSLVFVFLKSQLKRYPFSGRKLLSQVENRTQAITETYLRLCHLGNRRNPCANVQVNLEMRF